MTHELKCWIDVFYDMYIGLKTFEVRLNDRNYQVGDSLLLKEWDSDTNTYTGRQILKRVTYILYGGQFGLPENTVVMAIR